MRHANKTAPPIETMGQVLSFFKCKAHVNMAPVDLGNTSAPIVSMGTVLIHTKPIEDDAVLCGLIHEYSS